MSSDSLPDWRREREHWNRFTFTRGDFIVLVVVGPIPAELAGDDSATFAIDHERGEILLTTAGDHTLDDAIGRAIRHLAD